jgi:limonene-1,2-epoxide hydrolase
MVAEPRLIDDRDAPLKRLNVSVLTWHADASRVVVERVEEMRIGTDTVSESI